MLAFSAVGKTEARVVRRRMSRPDSGFATTPTIASPKAPTSWPYAAPLKVKLELAWLFEFSGQGPCPLSRAAMPGSLRQGHQEQAGASAPVALTVAARRARQ